MATTLTNTGVQFPDATTQTTAATGSVSSVATGSGLSGGTITTSGTISLVTTNGAVGTYGLFVGAVSGYDSSPGQNIAGSSLTWASASGYSTGSPSGTWQCRGFTSDVCQGNVQITTMWMRVA